MKKIAIIAGVGIMCVSALAQAATSTGNLSVSAIVVATCTVQSSSAPAFSNTNSARQAAQVGVSCSSATPYTISLDNANGASRQLISDGSRQSVPLYSTASGTQNGSADVVGITLSY